MKQGESSAAYLPVRGGTVRGSRWVRLALLLGVIAFVAIFFFADPAELWSVLTHANPWLLALPVIFCLLSYVTMARSYQGIAAAAGCPVPLLEMLKITFVANSWHLEAFAFADRTVCLQRERREIGTYLELKGRPGSILNEVRRQLRCEGVRAMSP